MTTALKLTTRNGNEMFRFDSVKSIDAFINKDYLKDSVSNASFLGREFASHEEYETALNEAWREGVDIMQMFVEKLEKAELPTIKSLKLKKVYSMEGDEPDFERMMQGCPDYYVKTEREATDGPGEVCVVIDTSTPGSERSDNILWRGAAAIALVKILEEQGYKAEIWVVNGSTLYAAHPSRGVMTACCLKRCEDVLDISTLINTVSGWFYRGEGFALIKSICDQEHQTPSYGLGSPHTPTSDDLDLIAPDQKRIYSSGVFSFHGSLDLMLSEVTKIASTTGEEGEPNE